MTTRRQFLSASAAFVPALLLARHAAANAIASVYSKNGIAIDGTDPVAYFTESRAVAGDPGITHEWSGVTWRFSSPGNRDAFSADPDFDAEAAFREVISVMKFHISAGEIEDVRRTMPEKLRALWDEEIPK